MNDLLYVRGQADTGHCARRLGPEFDVLGAVERLNGAGQMRSGVAAEHQAADADGIASDGAVAEFCPAEQAGDVGVGRVGGDVVGWAGLA